MMFKKTRSISPTLAKAFGAAAILLAQTNTTDASALPASSINEVSPYAIGSPILINNYSSIAEQNNQVSLAKFNIIGIGSNGRSQKHAGYITTNPLTGRGWLLTGNAELGQATEVTPILELNSIVMFNPLSRGGGIRNLSNAAPVQSQQNTAADCSRWSEYFKTSFDEPSLYNCTSKEAFYNLLSRTGGTVAIVGQVTNSSPLDANVFTLTFTSNAQEAERIGTIGRLGNNTWMSEFLISDYEIYPSVVNAIIDNGGDLAGFTGNQAQPSPAPQR